MTSFRTEEEATDSAAEEEGSESRTASPSGQGKGLRLGGPSFLNGLSSSSVGQGAGRLHRRGGDGSAAAGQETQAKSVGLPGLDGYDGDDDEGYGGGMDEDVDDVLPDVNAFIGPQRPPPSYQQATAISPYQQWSFAGIAETYKPPAPELGEDYAEADVDSNAAINDGDNDDQMRLLQDFGDDGELNTFDSAHHPSPVMQSTEMDFLGDQMQGVERFEDISDPEPVEIHIDSPPTVHEKKE